RSALGRERAARRARIGTGGAERTATTAPATATARRNRDAAPEIVTLGGISRTQRDHRTAVAHEHRLAVVAERDVRELTAPFVDQLGVAGAVRRHPANVAHARRRRTHRYRAASRRRRCRRAAASASAPTA